MWIGRLLPLLWYGCSSPTYLMKDSSSWL
jgi:hypothetical protein